MKMLKKESYIKNSVKESRSVPEVNVAERVLSAQQLVDHNAKALPVDCFVVAPLLNEELRGKVLVGAAESVGLLETFGSFLGDAKVSQDYESVLVQKNVFRFQISVNNVFAVDVVKG